MLKKILVVSIIFLFSSTAFTQKITKIYKVASGRVLKLDIYLSGSKKHPVLVYIHGGAWKSGSKELLMQKGNFKKVAGYYLKKGFAVVSVDYRLSGVAKFPAGLIDCKDAVRWLKKNAKKYRIDPNRIGVWGTSAGGNLALMVGLTEEHQFAGAKHLKGYSSKVKFVISWYGPTNLVPGPNNPTNKENMKTIVYYLGNTYNNIPSMYRLASPLNHIKKNSPPVLLIHGEKDRTVNFVQSEFLYKKSKKIGARVSLIPVKNAGHGFNSIKGKISPSMNHIQKKTLHFGIKYVGIGNSFQCRRCGYTNYIFGYGCYRCKRTFKGPNLNKCVFCSYPRIKKLCKICKKCGRLHKH